MNKLEIEVPEGKKVEWINGVLTLVDDKPKDVTERIKTFEDVCNELGGAKHSLVREYIYAMNIPGVSKDLIAYLKLRIVVAALNEGWEPQFTKDEYRYFPWFYFYSKREVKSMSKKNKQNLFRLSSTADYDGVACSDTHYAASYSNTYIGSRLAFKNSELAKYAGKQFIEIWADYIYYNSNQ